MIWFCFVCLTGSFHSSFSSSLSTPPKLNTDSLPDLPTILQSISLDEYLKDFVKKGITETRYLLRLGRMDFQLMEMDWGMPKEDVNTLRDKIKELMELALVPNEPEVVHYKERDGLKYGRIYVPHSVQSFEFLLASFGGSAPLGPQSLCLAQDPYGCDPFERSSDRVQDISGCIVVLSRGNCSFLTKALHAFQAHATGVIIINNENKIESLSSGLGVVPDISERDVNALKKFPVFCVSNTSLAKLSFSIRSTANNRLPAFTTPLLCGHGGKCVAVTPEEKLLSTECIGGSMTVMSSSNEEGKKNSASFDFMTSIFGGILTTSTV